MKERLLLTGGSGLLALNWANNYRNSSEIILGLHNRIINLEGVKTNVLDLTSFDSISRSIEKIKPTCIINTAGVTNVEKCEDDVKYATAINSTLASNLSKACFVQGVKFVHISTDHLFDGKKAMYSEGEEMSPLNVYGHTKGRAEKEISFHNSDALIVRTNFYGWGPSYRASFSDFIIKSLRANKEINLFDDVFYTPIFIGTLTRAITSLINKEAKGIYNIVGRDRVSKYEFGLKLAEIFKLDSSLIQRNSLKSRKNLVERPMDMSLSNQKLCDFLGEELASLEEDLTMLREQDSQGLNKEIIGL